MAASSAAEKRNCSVGTNHRCTTGLSKPKDHRGYNVDGNESFEGALIAVDNVTVRLVATTRDAFIEGLRDRGANLIVVNLDTGDGLEILEWVSKIYPDCGLIAVSKRTDPSLIIGAMRAGCGQFVPLPAEQADLQKAVDRTVRGHTFQQTEAKRVCVIGSSGGAGATTLACNLSIELAGLTKQSCGLIDLNLELGDVGCVLDIDPQYTVSDLCTNDVQVDEHLLEQAFHELPDDVHVLVRPRRVEDAHGVTPEGVEKMLEVTTRTFPYVVVDLPPYTNFLSAVALRETDLAILVTQLGVSFIRNTTRIRDCLLIMGTPEERIEVVLNRYQSDHATISPEVIEEHFGKPVFASIPNDYQRIRSSLDTGRAIKHDSPKSPARLAIRELARKIAGVDGQAKSKSGRGRGLLRRIMHRTA